MEYENRLVIFLDILGFREIIKRTNSEKGTDNKELIESVYKAIDNYDRFFSDRGIDDDLFRSKQITQFSDSIVISFILKEPGDIIFTLSNCLHLIMSLVWRGFLCRGGIAYGKLIHTDKIIFGPALVEAYDLETKAALYPRIIFSQNVLDSALLAYDEIPEIEKVDLYYGIEQIQDFLVKDFDGLYFIDYIRKVQEEIDEENLMKYYRKLKQLIEGGMKSNVEHIMVKYSWMKEKYNDFASKAKSKETAKLLKEHPKENAVLIEFCKDLQYIK